MSKIKVGTITNVDDTNPVYFPTGVSGDGSNLTFQPNAISFDPVATSTGISTTTNINVIFDQDIEFSGVGTIYIREDSPTGTISTYFTCGVSTEATIAGSSLVIDPRDSLSFGQLYVVTLPSVGIANTFGQYYRGTNGYSFRTAVQSFSASGGTHEFTIASPTSPTGYHKYHVFTSTGILTTTDASANATDLAAILIGAGGGGGDGYFSGFPAGSAPGGGGGAGGFQSFTGPTLALTSGSHTITIGAGGIATTGNNSTIESPDKTITSYGGGGGGNSKGAVSPTVPIFSTFPGLSGGSGGGGSGYVNPPSITNYGNGTPGQGNRGGTSTLFNTDAPTYQPSFCAGGGGGAGGVGGNGATPSPTRPPGIGGSGGPGSPNTAFNSTLLSPYVNTIPTDSWSKIGPTGLYAGGGGGMSAAVPQAASYKGGLGGPGGGGQGAQPNSAPPWSTGTTAHPAFIGESGYQGTGGGGGGGMHSSISPQGGSGVFMIRYAVPAP